MIYLCVCICVCALYIYICISYVMFGTAAREHSQIIHPCSKYHLSLAALQAKICGGQPWGKLLMSGSFWFAGQSLATMQDRKHCTVAERSNNLFTPGLQPTGCTIANGQTIFGTQPRDLEIPRWIIIFHNCPKYTKIYQHIPC